MFLNCCNKLIKPKAAKANTLEGLKIFKYGHCPNPKCNGFNLIIETILLFGRTKEEYLRGKKAVRELEKYTNRVETVKKREYRKNTAKGFNYAKSGFSKGKEVQETRELATDRLLSRNEIELIAV